MRKTLEIGCGLGFLLTLLLTVAIHGTAAQVRQDTLRLHVVANSDTWEDQLCKLAVRDAVLQTAADALHSADFFYDTSKHDLSSLPQSVPRVGGQQDVARHLLDLDA